MSSITWITRSESIPLIKNNPYIDEAIPFGTESLLTLSSRRFDQLINLDAGKISSSLATMAEADIKVGYLMHEGGYVYATNEAAEKWLRMGVFDDLKKANQTTYQEVMCSILGIPATGMRYLLRLTPEEEYEGDRHLQNIGIDPGKKLIGIHTGGGGRWVLKQWNEEGFHELIPRLVERTRGEAQILILGGPLEKERNKRILERARGPVFDGGCDNEVRHFAALVRRCSVLLSSDSLAMHVGLSMGARVVVVFGPTSHTEIELFGQGEKVIPAMDCLVCYKQTCDYKPNCMDSIPVGIIEDAILRQLALANR